MLSPILERPACRKCQWNKFVLFAGYEFIGIRIRFVYLFFLQFRWHWLPIISPLSPCFAVPFTQKMRFQANVFIKNALKPKLLRRDCYHLFKWRQKKANNKVWRTINVALKSYKYYSSNGENQKCILPIITRRSYL